MGTAGVRLRGVRVLIATHNYPRFAGDPAGAFVHRLATAAARDGAEVMVVCPAAPGTPLQEDAGGVMVRRFAYPGGRSLGIAYTGDLHRRATRRPAVALALPFFLRAFGRAVRRATAETRPDVIHAHWWIPAGWQAARAGRPYLITCHGSDIRLLDQWKPLRLIARPVFAGAGAVTTVSAFLADDVARLTGRPRDQIVVAPMPVDVDLFAQGRGTPKADPPRVLYAGNLVPSKGVNLLLAALRRLRERGVGCRLRILGEGPAERGLHDLAGQLAVARDVEWSPFVPQSEMPREYGASTVTALPTRGRHEGLGLTLVEALLAGSAVVGSAVGGIPEVVEDGVTGLLFRDGDVEGLAGALERLVRDPSLRARLIAAGQARMAAQFGWDVAARRFLSIYDDVAARQDALPAHA